MADIIVGGSSPIPTNLRVVNLAALLGEIVILNNNEFGNGASVEKFIGQQQLAGSVPKLGAARTDATPIDLTMYGGLLATVEWTAGWATSQAIKWEPSAGPLPAALPVGSSVGSNVFGGAAGGGGILALNNTQAAGFALSAPVTGSTQAMTVVSGLTPYGRVVLVSSAGVLASPGVGTIRVYGIPRS